MLSKVKYVKQQNIENPNNGKRNANLDKVLIYRAAIKQVANDVKKSRDDRRDDWAFYIVALLSLVIEDIEGDVLMDPEGFHQHFYASTKKLREFFGVERFVQVTRILKELEKAGFIKYRLEGTCLNRGGIRFNVQMLKYTEYLFTNSEGSGCDRDARIYNAVNSQGFLYVPLRRIINDVMKAFPNYAPGNKDILVHIFNNVVFKDEECMNYDAFKHHLAQFGQTYIAADGDTVSEANYVVRIGEWAEHLNLSYSELNETLDYLQRLGYIKRRFVRNRGTAIIFSALDSDKDDEDYDATINRIFKFIELNSYKYKMKRAEKRFTKYNYVNKRTKGHIKVYFAKKKADVFARLDEICNRLAQNIPLPFDEPRMTNSNTVLATAAGPDITPPLSPNVTLIPEATYDPEKDEELKEKMERDKRV